MAGGPTELAIESTLTKVLGVAVHDLRSPLGIAVGYLRMLVKEQFGPLSDQQRNILRLIEKACARMAELLEEASRLEKLEKGEVTLNRSRVDLRTLLADTFGTLPDLQDRTVTVELLADGEVPIEGDGTLLKDALAAMVIALRRELVTSDSLIVRLDRVSVENKPFVRIMVAEPDRMPQLLGLPLQELPAFDECVEGRRGGNGFSLFIARWVIEAHGGALFAPQRDSKAAAIVTIPGI